ncbi:MAG: hypothetical protein LBR06_02335 [Bacteroidales bacterium]|nr:hypothetical protein [Bacteroidales bacterium]
MKTLTLIAAFMLCIAATGCKKDRVPAPEPELSVSKSEISFSAEGGAYSLTVTANRDWTAAIGGDWLSVSPPKGEVTASTTQSGSYTTSITVDVARNVATAERTSKLQFSIDGTVMAEVTVTQSKYGPTLSVSPDAAAFPADGGSLPFAVTVNNDDAWTLDIPADATWLTASGKTATALTLTAAANRDITARTAILLFRLVNYPETTREVAVTQNEYGPALTVLPLSKNFTDIGGDTVFVVTVNNGDAWTLTVPPDATWLTASGKTATSVKLTAAANASTVARSSTVVFQLADYPDTKQEVPITQDAHITTLSVTPETLPTVEVGGSEVTFTVTTNNDEWELSIPANAAWLSQTGKTATSVKLAVAANRTVTIRTATVTFKLKNYPAVTKTVAVSQAAYIPKLVVATETALDFPSEGGSLPVTVTVNNEDAWALDIPADAAWLTASGKTATALTLTAAANPANTLRGATLTFRLTDYPETVATVSVTQAATLIPATLNAEIRAMATAFLDGHILPRSFLGNTGHITDPNMKLIADQGVILYDMAVLMKALMLFPQENESLLTGFVEALYNGVNIRSNTDFVYDAAGVLAPKGYFWKIIDVDVAWLYNQSQPITGESMWVASAMADYCDKFTGTAANHARELVQQLTDAALAITTPEGLVKMAPKDPGDYAYMGINYNDVVSIENNISALKVFRWMAENATSNRAKYVTAADKLEAAIIDMFDPARLCFYAGKVVSTDVLNSAFATDCSTWSILCMGVERFDALIAAKYGVSEASLKVLKKAVELAGVNDGARQGLDFTDRVGSRIVSFEWTCGFLEAAKLVLAVHPDASLEASASAMRTYVRNSRDSNGLLPYTDASGFFDTGFGWTAIPGVASLASSAWELFDTVSGGINPFNM